MRFVHDLIDLYILILFAVMILSWFPVHDSRSGLGRAKLILARITEPVLRPIRSVLPRPNFGGVVIDFSVLVAIIILSVINSII
jgi:YggT family protein